MTVKQIDEAIASEHRQTDLSRRYVQWLESLREWTKVREDGEISEKAALQIQSMRKRGAA